MSLGVALNVAKISLNQTEQRIALTSSNIANADRDGYTRKVLKSNYQNTGDVTIPYGGYAVRAYTDDLLTKQVNQQSTAFAYSKSLSEYLSRYSQAYGSTADGASTLSNNYDNLLSSLQILEGTPTDSSAKSKVITTAQTITSSLNQITSAIQAERLRANNEIAMCVTSINDSLERITQLNAQIGVANATGTSSGDLEDTRDLELQNLAQQIGIQYFKDDKNQVQVFALNGATLIGGIGHANLSYNPVGGVTATTVYPGGFGPINLGSLDITSTTFRGRLGALIELRDRTLPDEQAKVDAFANQMMNSVNAALNKGTAYPPANTLTGTVSVTAATSLAGATGNFRVAVVDKTGIVQATADINMASVGTVGGLITALNGISGISASLDADGNLVIDATNPLYGVSTNPLNSSVGGMSATQYFGLNNLFVNKGTTAGSIAVNPNLINDNNALAIATLSSGTLAAGDRGLSSGDASAITTLLNTITGTLSFAAAGDFGARTSTLSNYIGAIMAGAATKASSAKTDFDATSSSVNYLKENLANSAGVNIDEETANLTVLQTQYQANAQLIATVKTLFDTLIRAIS